MPLLLSERSYRGVHATRARAQLRQSVCAWRSVKLLQTRQSPGHRAQLPPQFHHRNFRYLIRAFVYKMILPNRNAQPKPGSADVPSALSAKRENDEFHAPQPDEIQTMI